MSDELKVEGDVAVVDAPKVISITDVLTAIAKINKIIGKFTDPATLKLLQDFVVQLLSEANVKAAAPK